tara:strand:- start:6661 stop:7044 length:384 start_codon:yes stop_codon:yes gene_type:complete
VTRPLPLAILALVFMWLATNVETVWIWVLNVVVLAALVALIIGMRFRDMYTGPKTLSDDVMSVSRRVMRDEGGEADRIAYLKELEEEGEERHRTIEDALDYEPDSTGTRDIDRSERDRSRTGSKNHE